MTDRIATGPAIGHAAAPLRARLRAHAYRLRVPLRVEIELTKRCNLRCVHCYLERSSAEREMTTAEIKHLVAQLADEGCMYVTLTGGEVMLRPDVLEICEEVKRRRMVLSLLTNGSLFEPQDIERLVVVRPATVGVSIYAGSARLHDEITGVKGSFEASLETLRRLRQHDITCRVQCLLMNENVDEFRAVVRLAESLGCRFVFDPTVAPGQRGGREVLAHRVDADRLRAFYVDDLLVDRTREGRIVTHVGDMTSQPFGNCQAGFTSAFVEATGEVYPCMGLEPSFGNVTRMGFAEVWRSDSARRHREAMLVPLSECEGCDLLRFCTARCPRLALVEDGDLSGGSRRACELAGVVRDMRQVTRSA